VEVLVRTLSILTALMLCIPVAAVAQTSTNPNPPGPHSTVGAGTTNLPSTSSAQDLSTKLESLGYTHVTDIISTPEGLTAKAVKGDKPMTIVIDASGKVTESQIGP
jgi:hypothetical protein